MFYYKEKANPTNFLILKEELGETELENYIEITESQYNELILQAIQTSSSDVENIKARIAALKQQLFESDYQAIKYAEGCISKTDYAPIKAQRQSIRDEINSLEEQLENDEV